MTYVTEENLTDIAVERWSNIPEPRLRQIMTSLVKNLHAFVRDVEPTPQEWFAAIDWLTRIGQSCDAKRQEFILASDVLGVSMLVDCINNRSTGHRHALDRGRPVPHRRIRRKSPTAATWQKARPAPRRFFTGRITDVDGKPIAGAMLDMWQTDGEGLYEAQIDGVEGYMRGIYHSNPDGSYSVRTVAPIGYTIPMDRPIGELMSKTKVSHMRPAHVHFHIAAPGYKSLTTHLFQKGCHYIDTDVVFGVKEPLIVGIRRAPGRKGAEWRGDRQAVL